MSLDPSELIKAVSSPFLDWLGKWSMTQFYQMRYSENPFPGLHGNVS